MTTCTRCKTPVEGWELVKIAGKPVCLGCTSDDELARLFEEGTGLPVEQVFGDTEDDLP